MNLQPDAHDAAFREEVRTFIAGHLTPQMRVGQAATSGSYPPPAAALPWQRALADRGWLAPLWPRAHGGTGWSGLQRFIFENECALAGAPLIHPMGVRFVGPVIIRFGTPQQQRQFLPRILSSEDYWCQGFSEPGAGSDLASLSLQARRDGDAYVLQGSKIWTTNAHCANWMFALVRTSRGARPQEGISFVLVDMRSPGITVRPIETIGGDHDLNQVFFDEVRVPLAQRVGEEGQGWECAKYLLEFERGAGIFAPRLRSQLKRVGAALRQAGDAGAHWHERWGALCAALDAFEWLEVRTLAGLAPGTSPGPVSSVLKLRASRLRQDIAQLGVEVLGEDALRWRSDSLFGGDASRLAKVMVPDYFNSRAYTIFGGAAEIQLNLVARMLLAGDPC
jgi:acyl-CoA dehydrogenase